MFPEKSKPAPLSFGSPSPGCPQGDVLPGGHRRLCFLSWKIPGQKLVDSFAFLSCLIGGLFTERKKCLTKRFRWGFPQGLTNEREVFHVFHNRSGSRLGKTHRFHPSPSLFSMHFRIRLPPLLFLLVVQIAPVSLPFLVVALRARPLRRRSESSLPSSNLSSIKFVSRMTPNRLSFVAFP